MFSNIIQGFGSVLQPNVLLVLALGTIGGLIVGALPGLSANMAVALSVPLTFSMPPVQGIALLSAVYCSAIYGGSISAILLNIPGTISSFATTLDGYPMAKAGKVNLALGTSSIASVFGGLFSAIVLMFLAPSLAKVALKFGPSEYFAVTMLGLACLASIGGEGSVIKSLISGVLGLLVTCIGMDPTTGTLRYTFGNFELMDGVSLVPAMTGMFGVLAVYQLIERRKELQNKTSMDIPSVKGSIWIGRENFKKIIPTCFRGSVIGTLIGIMPGIGTSVSTMLAYDWEKKLSKNPENFGKGEIRGVAAPESSNNALTGGSMIPLLALGVPGNATSALFLGALLVQGITTGPTMFVTHSNFVYGLFASFFLANIVMYPFCILILRFVRKLLSIDERLLGAIIIAFCVVGVYVINKRFVDILIMIIFGLLAFAFTKLHIPTSPMIIGMALGSLAEKNLWQALTISQGSINFLWNTPITAIVMIVAILSFLVPLFAKFRRK